MAKKTNKIICEFTFMVGIIIVQLVFALCGTMRPPSPLANFICMPDQNYSPSLHVYYHRFSGLKEFVAMQVI